MADKENNTGSTHEEWLDSQALKKYGGTAIAVVVGVALAIAAGINFFGKSGKHAVENKSLGRAYIYLGKGQPDSARAILEVITSQSQPPIVLAKAHLLLGKIHYNSKQFPESMASYLKVAESGVKDPLLQSGALHGLASAYMEQGDYPKAIETLEEFVANYMRRTGDLEKRSLGEEPADLSPAVSNVLWKLALSYWRTGQKEKTREACERIVKVYGDKEEAGKARRLLQTI